MARRPGEGARQRPAHSTSSAEVYQERYLIRRPLLQALQAPEPGAVLLIDEVDRADEPFEAFLLEYLGEYQVSIPEIGTTKCARWPPVTILTSNRTRELNDAVKRRCLYHWLDYPERERELAIVRAQVPGRPATCLSASRWPSLSGVCAAHRSPAHVPARARHRRERGMGTRPGRARHAGARPRGGGDTAGILFKQREDVAALTPALTTQTCCKPVAEAGA